MSFLKRSSDEKHRLEGRAADGRLQQLRAMLRSMLSASSQRHVAQHHKQQQQQPRRALSVSRSVVAAVAVYHFSSVCIMMMD